MAGHFLLNSITQSDHNVALQQTGVSYSALQHANVGWTLQSRQTFINVLNGIGIGNRNNLPPHRYLQIGAAPIAETISYLRGAGWVDLLTRPNTPGFGLRALTGPAQIAWNAGNKAEALITQVNHGNVSIEIYYTSGYEMS